VQGAALQLKRLIDEHNLQRAPWVARVLAAIEHGMISDAMARNLLHAIEPLVRDALDHPNFLHPAPEHSELYPSAPPDIEIGHLVDRPDVRFGLRLADRPRSILIAGNSGAGKTTVARNIILQTDSIGTTVIVFDRKQDYIDLPDLCHSDWLRVSVYDMVRIGLDAPDGVPPKAWVNIVASIFSARAGMIAAWTAFAAVLWWLLGVLNADPNHPTRWPSLQLVLDVLNAAPEKLFAAKAEYVGTLKTALQTAVQAVDTFDCFGGLDLERDIIRPGKSIVIEMPNVTPAWIRQLIQDLLIAQLIYGRVHRAQKSNRGAEVILVMDEADQDATLESDRRFPDQMSPLSLLLRMGREFGLMVIVGASRLNHLSPYVLLEPSYHLILNQSDAASILAARNTLLLPPGAEQMLPGLQPGMCIVRENGGPWSHPLLVQLDPPSQGVN
jgi:DNA helicase HerA-like ATPase